MLPSEALDRTGFSQRTAPKKGSGNRPGSLEVKPPHEPDTPLLPKTLNHRA